MFCMRITPQTRPMDAIVRIHHLIKDYAFESSDKQCIFISASEVIHNVQDHAGGNGVLQCSVTKEEFQLTCSDYGDGIQNLDEILRGSYTSPKGLGMGLSSIQRLMDKLYITTSSEGTTIVASKRQRRREQGTF